MCLINERQLNVLGHVVDLYIETGQPVSSRAVAQRFGMLSSASIRNIMADLEDDGMLISPHTSAGRLPTERGVRTYIAHFMGMWPIEDDVRHVLQSQCINLNSSLEDILSDLVAVLADFAQGVGMVWVTSHNANDMTIKHIQIVFLHPGRAMIVMVNNYGHVIDRFLETPLEMTERRLNDLSQYLQTSIVNKTIKQALQIVRHDISAFILDSLCGAFIENILHEMSSHNDVTEVIVRGQSHLMQQARTLQEIYPLIRFFDGLASSAHHELNRWLHQRFALDAKFLSNVSQQEKHSLQSPVVEMMHLDDFWDLAGYAMLVLPYQTSHHRQLQGILGIMGPRYMRYDRIVPMMVYTSHLMSRFL